MIALRAGVRVALASAARVGRHGRFDLLDEIGLDDRERRHLLAWARLGVPLRLRPVPPAGAAVGTAGTLRGRPDGGGAEFLHDGGFREGSDLHGGGHPSGQVGLERWLVVVARALGLARHLDHDVAAGEEDVGALEQTIHAFSPQRRSISLAQVSMERTDGGEHPRTGGETYVVVHVGSTHQQGPGVIRPLDLAGDRAIVRDLCAIVDLIVFIEDDGVFQPVPGFDGPFGIGRIPRVSGQSSGQLEKAAVGDGVFVIVAFVERKDLPP